nr:Protein T15D6.4 [Haemonchus contortus]
MMFRRIEAALLISLAGMLILDLRALANAILKSPRLLSTHPFSRQRVADNDVVMKNLPAVPRSSFFCLYLLAFFILIVEYRRYTQETSYSNVPAPFPSMLYHNYCVHYDVIEPMFTDFDRIAQILHVSADVLDRRIVQQVANWNGPVSLTVVLRTINQYHCTIEFLKKIRQESLDVAHYLRAHIVFEKAFSSNCTVPSILPSLGSSSASECENHKATIDQIAHYPANLARNVARIFSSSKYIIITDYEHLFSEGFEVKVRSIASRRLAERSQTILAYRIFEIDKKISKLPRNKSDLHKLFKSQHAVVFHSRYYPGAHDITGLEEWFSKNKTTDGLFAKDQKYDRSNWEPQFVSHSRIPFHDERFPFQLRDNTVLRWELCRANYTIDILDDVFMFHRGIKLQKNMESLRIQMQNTAIFNEALKAFKERMDKEYPETKHRCPTPER